MDLYFCLDSNEQSIRNRSILAWASGPLSLVWILLNRQSEINQFWPGPLDLYFCLDSKEIFIYVWILMKSQSEINQSWAGPVDLYFFWIRVKSQLEINQSWPGPLDLYFCLDSKEKSIRNQSILAWAFGSPEVIDMAVDSYAYIHIYI